MCKYCMQFDNDDIDIKPLMYKTINCGLFGNILLEVYLSRNLKGIPELRAGLYGDNDKDIEKKLEIKFCSACGRDLTFTKDVTMKSH